MCKAWEEQKEFGKKIGQEIGEKIGREMGKEIGQAKRIIEMGEDYGIPEDEIILKLQEKLDISSDKAMEYIEMYSKKLTV